MLTVVQTSCNSTTRGESTSNNPFGAAHVAASVAVSRNAGVRGARAGSIYQSILDAVVEHRLPPGAKLTEEQLGAIFGASRTTVRSALQALAHDHIVTLTPHRSAFVAAPDVETARDIFDSRKLVEREIAREVALCAEPERIAALRALLTEEEAALAHGDRGAAIRLSGAFHIAIAATRGEGALTAFLKSLISQSSLAIALYGRRQSRPCRHHEHVALLDALADHDAERAAALMGEHLDHILGDLDLVAPDAGAVDLAFALQSGR